jgi:hypothetical protein
VHTLCDPSLASLARQLGDLVVRIKPISQHKIVVEWAEPKGKHSLLTIRLREFQSYASVLHEPPRGLKRIVLGDLKPRTTYTIQVHNRDLESQYFSDPMYARTWPSRSARAKRQEFVLKMKHGSYFASPYHLPDDPDASSSSSSSSSGSASSSRSGDNGDSPISPPYFPIPSTSGYATNNSSIHINYNDSANFNDGSAIVGLPDDERAGPSAAVTENDPLLHQR